MTTTYYKINTGPGRDDLLDSLVNGKTVWFKAFDSNTNHPSMFVVRVTKLGLKPENKTSWTIDGVIVTKNGKNPGIYKKCKVSFDSHDRCGSFFEVEQHKQNSYEYFKELDDSAIRAIIRDSKNSIPKGLKKLDEYGQTLDPRERLILEAMHITTLDKACMGVQIFHQLSALAYK
jgi:hypothetical protein